MVGLFHFMELKMITKMPFYLGMVNTLYKFMLNIAYIENIRFVDAYTML